MTTPVGVMRAILFPEVSANQRFPSGPRTIASGEDKLVGIPYSAVSVPFVLIRPILLACCVNHSAPSGPATMPRGPLLPAGRVKTSMEAAALLRAVASAEKARTSSARKTALCPYPTARQRPARMIDLLRSPIRAEATLEALQRSTWKEKLL